MTGRNGGEGSPLECPTAPYSVSTCPAIVGRAISTHVTGAKRNIERETPRIGSLCPPEPPECPTTPYKVPPRLAERGNADELAKLDLLARGKLWQACPCGVTEAAGPYCTKCLRPTGPEDWYVPERTEAQKAADLAGARRFRGAV